ncbi:MAG: glycosyltransferase family 4 protein [Elusimicrobia bacterium]|nr:glycosyltransferase family 4 protein [Elusimicrobiota bacterium]
MPLPKIGIVHHNILSHRGGGDMVCAWTLEALKSGFDTTFITWGGEIDWKEVDHFYGTNIQSNPIKILYHPILTALHMENRPYRLIISLLERYLKSLAPQFDLFYSTYNELDMGKPGIQYIHGPSRSDTGAKYYLLEYQSSWPRRIYHEFCNWYSGFDPSHAKRNYTLVNSNWTIRVVQETFGEDIAIETVYPPVCLLKQPVPWREKKNQFLCIGDLLPVKKTHESFDVIGKLREKGHDVSLIIVGDGPEPYSSFVKNEAKKYPFVTCTGRINREKVSELIATSKYGIHMRDYEGFGIAIAEMVRGGAIPFAPGHGGQIEVLGNHNQLLFKDRDDAVNKIDQVLRQPQLQNSILEHLRKAGENFSESRYVQQVRSIVQRQLAR